MTPAMEKLADDEDLQHEGVPADGGYLHPPLRHGEELTAVREHPAKKRWSQQRAGQCTRTQTTQHSTSMELAHAGQL